MANILPLNAQKNVWAMYRARFALALGLALIALAAVAFLMLLPSHAALFVAAPPVPHSSVSAGHAEDTAALDRAQALIRELRGTMISSTSSISAAEEVLAMRPKGVKVARFFYQISGEQGQLTFSGEGTREGISTYRDTLIKSGKFSSISVPVGSLVAATGGNFTIVVNGDF